MINDHTLARFETLADGLLKPVYDGYSFANLAATFHYLLTGERTGALLPVDCFGSSYPSPKKIVLFFIDSFGWQFWRRHADQSRLMRRVIANGILTPISALFPSTTAASVSTLNLGCLPASHAVYEWNMYVPAFGETIQSLPFATLGTRPVPCVSKGFDARDMVIKHRTMHQRLARHGVRSIQLSHRNFAHSPYNQIASAGAEVIVHTTLHERLGQLKHVLAATAGKALINLYWAGLDASAHTYGPGSPEHRAEIASFWLTMDALLADAPSEDTLFLFTADHGHTGSTSGDTLYINERWPQINDCLSTSHTGLTIWPNGSPRDMFLHAKPERRAELFQLLHSGLDGIATVMTVDDALAAGLFGQEPAGDELRRRLGDILVLPRLGHFIWWHEPGIMSNPLLGHHGGLSPEELITVLAVLDSVSDRP